MTWAVPEEILAEGPDAIRRARLLVSVVLAMTGLGLVAVGFLASLGRVRSSMMVLTIVPTALGLAVPWVLRRTGSLVWAGNLGIALAFSSIGFIALLTGGLGRPILGIQALVPLLAVLVIGVRSGIFWTALACLEAGGLYWLHLRNFEFPAPPPVESQDWINLVLAVMLFIMVLVLGATYESLKNAALRHLEAVNRDLARSRDTAQEATRAAEEASRVRGAFLATMSHEIRTPMNAVIGMAGLLEGTKLDAEQSEFAATIRRSGESLLTILNDILDFSKIESGKLDIELVPFDLQETVDEVADLLALRANSGAVELACEVSAEAPRSVVGDPTRVRQILLNLLSNAVKFTERGEIHLSVDSKRLEDGRDEIHFAVRDTGIGIPTDRLDRLFHSFSQVDASTTRRYGGTGLGLAISRRLAELMGGRIWVESEEGAGSTFHFTLVATRAADLTSLEKRRAAEVLRGKKVLVVDDNPTSREILGRMTRAWGMEPTSCGDEAEAAELLASDTAFDVALIDLLLPEPTGRELARRARELPHRRALPMVALSPLGREREEKDASSAFEALVTKPVKPRALVEALAPLFGRRTRPRAAPAEQTPDLGRTHPLRILLAEDNRVNQLVAVKMLERLGYTTEVASDGAQALEAVERHPFDVVFMDVQMPEVDGLEATRALCARWPADVRPRIIALTANARDEERQACLEAGMDDFLSKPVGIQALIDALRSCERRPDRIDSTTIPAEPRRASS